MAAVFRNMDLLDRIVALGDELRRHGVPVASSEIIDAARAVELAGLSGRQRLKVVLASTLVKRAEHGGLFQAAFAVHFPVEYSATQNPIPADPDDPMEWQGIVDQALDKSANMGDDTVLQAVANAAVGQFAGLVPGRFLGTGYHARRVLRQLEEVGALSVGEPSGDGLDGLDRALAQYRQSRRRTRLQQAVAAEIDQMAGRPPESTPLAADRLDLLRLTPAEAAELRSAVDAMGRRLAARLRRQRRASASGAGRLHVGATVRRSLATGGVPFVPVLRRYRPRRPELVVLADVSGSVATFARFTLRLIHCLTGQFGQVRTFAFVDEIDEVTALLGGTSSFEAAMTTINQRAQTQGLAGHSDYGKVFGRFGERWPKVVKPTTTVLILGDARNNYHSVGATAFANVVSGARRVYWLNPEPRSHWNTGDSVMAAYGPFCTDVLECRTIAQLAVAVNRL